MATAIQPKWPRFMSDDQERSNEYRALLKRVHADDAGAFDELAMLSAERLRSLARHMLRRYPHVRRWEETDDVFQAALIRLHRSLTEVRPSSEREFIGLAVTQIRRTLIDLARHYFGVLGSGARHHTDGNGRAADEAGGPLQQASATGEEPDSLRQWTEFHEAIESLPGDECEAFSLIWYGGLSQREAAKLLDISERTMIRRLNRARLTLHDRMHGQNPNDEGEALA